MHLFDVEAWGLILPFEKRCKNRIDVSESLL
jgi:hypothetical protein